MRQKDVVVGKVYLCKVSGLLCPVRVDTLNERMDYAGRRRQSFSATNMRTGRKLIVSAARLRKEVRQVEGKWRLVN